MVVEAVEENTNVEFVFSYDALEAFSYEIKAIVLEYYDGYLPATFEWSYSNILEDNTVYGSWSSDYLNYRCYSYVMGYDEYVQPGQIEWILLGNQSSAYQYNFYSANIEAIAGNVEDDLEKLGYSYSEASTVMPNTNVSLHTHLICMRKDADTSGDYHFMELGTDGYWYHKPGKTNPLRYDSVPSNDVPWVVECYDGSTGKYIRDTDITYESEIYYIEYTTPHEWDYASAGTNQHERVCTICDYSQTLSCEYEYTYLYDDMHSASCRYCGNGYTGAYCTFDYADNGNGTHTGDCVCGNVRTASCYFEYTNISSTRHRADCILCDASKLEQCTTTCVYSGTLGTHNIVCSACEQSEEGNCSLVYVYNGEVDGQKTHIRVCEICDYHADAALNCVFNSDGICRFCGIEENFEAMQRIEEETAEG